MSHAENQPAQEAHAAWRSLADAMAVWHRGVAGLAVRRARHALVHAGGDAICGVPAERESNDRYASDRRRHASWIQASFLVGWALGGGIFGRIGDRFGRSRALMLTILTYAIFTGLSFFAHAWWHLMIFRFLAALGIGGEWAVGASILSETWPTQWRPWIAAVLQTGVNLGNLAAAVASMILLTWLKLPDRVIFLVGILPALLVLWIRHSVPEPEEWKAAKKNAAAQPRFVELFKSPVRRITITVILVCATSLSGHWAFMFWFPQQLRRLPDVQSWSDSEKNGVASTGLALVMIMSICGNFFAGFLAKKIGYRRAVSFLCLAYFISMMATYSVARDHDAMLWWLITPGLSQGVFALFTMYLPPLFPTLLRTTGRGLLLQHRPHCRGGGHDLLWQLQR